MCARCPSRSMRWHHTDQVRPVAWSPHRKGCSINALTGNRVMAINALFRNGTGRHHLRSGNASAFANVDVTSFQLQSGCRGAGLRLASVFLLENSRDDLG